MRLACVLTAAAIAVTMSAGGGVARSSTSMIPAEFPPASYKGRQYVDSKGCVYVRAGVDGNVTWVPRMTRKRQQVCGFQPTLSAAATPAKATAKKEPAKVAKQKRAAPQPAPAKTPVVAVRKKPASPTRAKVAAAHARPAPATGAGKPKATPPAKRTAYRRAPARVVAPKPVHAASLVPRRVAVSRVPDEATSGQKIMVVPRHVYAKRLVRAANLAVPDGYVPVWKDDRLNPLRAFQTPEGQARMENVWTNTVPRRLIERPDGQEVMRNAALTGYAATGDVAQQATLASVSTRGKAPQPARAASHRYVQLGAFADRDHALHTARRIARSGLPVRMADYRRDSKAYKIVLAGPFRTEARLMEGLKRVRAMGFPMAVLRK